MATMANPANMPQFKPGNLPPFMFHPASIPNVYPGGGNFDPAKSLDIKCRATAEMHNGFFFSDQPVNYFVRIFPLQLCSVAVIHAVCQLALIPIGLTPVAAQIMAGLIAGTQGFGRIPNYKKTMIPEKGGTHLSETLGTFGCMLYLFLIGVKVDVGTIKRASKKEWTIGILTFIFPLGFTLPLRYLLITLYKDDLQDFPFEIISITTSTTSFHAITCFLFDLKILNTELGRLATSISTISGLCSWIIILVTFAAKQKKKRATLWIGFMFSTLGQVIFITMVLRKLVLWMIKQTPPGKSLKEFYVFSIFFMIVGTGFLGEVFGQHCMFGPMILGLAIPNGPPVGSALEHTLDGFVAGVIMPLYFFSIGCNVNLRMVDPTYTNAIILYFGVGFLGKFIGTIIPCLCYGIPFRETVTLGLILGNLGIFDIQTYTTAKITEIMGPEIYPIMILTALGGIVVIAPLVRLLYNPSRRYIVYKKRTIQNIRHNAEFRILVCIYNEENVQTMINILAVSNPTTESPISIYLLNIIELTGRAAPLLLSHKSHENLPNDSTPENHIINGFKNFERQNQGVINVQPFTAITHFLFAHDDICMIAVERRISFIVIPFHKQWNIDGTTKSCKWGNTNKQVLKYAPCSVGILIDRRGYSGTTSVNTTWLSSPCDIGVIFLGDADDREATCYGMRMALHPNVNMTLHRLIPVATKIYNMNEKKLDKNVIDHYKLHYAGKERCTYEEEVVKDTVEIINVIQAVENAYDLILVGRNHNSYSTILSGLKDWSEYPELGFFGEVFATSDFRDKASVLVIQQHSCDAENPLPDESDKV